MYTAIAQRDYRRIHKSIALAVLFACPLTNASIISYADRATFDSQTSTVTETFEGLAPIGGSIFLAAVGRLQAVSPFWGSAITLFRT
jgi:hypothetical protein